MNLSTQPYLTQLAQWPHTGNHILAQFDQESVIVYQAYNPAIGLFAAKHQHFGGDFNFQRTSWIKPGFLWMMYRSGWGTKPDQEVTLAIRINRAGFDAILGQAVHSHFIKEFYPSYQDWKSALDHSSVVLQWDPDHDPSGAKVKRHAIQLGLRGEALANYAEKWIVDIEDISEFVRNQRIHAQANAYTDLIIPQHAVYPVTQNALTTRLHISTTNADNQHATS